MSIDIMNRIWWRDFAPEVESLDEGKYPGSHKNLAWTLIALADSAGDEGFCWPAIETIARKARLSTRAVQMALRQAEALGLLRSRQRLDRSTQYIFVLERLPHVDRPRRAKEKGPVDYFEQEIDLFETGESHAPLPPGRVHGMHPTGAGDSRTGESHAPRTVREPSIEPSESSLAISKSPDAEIDDDLIEYVRQRYTAIATANPGVAGIRKIDDSLKHTIRVRAQQHARKGDDPKTVWGEAFDNVEASDFLRGRVGPGAGRTSPFRLTLAWMAKADKFREIIGGKFNADRTDHTAYDAATGRRRGPAEQAAAVSLSRMEPAQGSRAGGRDTPRHFDTSAGAR